MDVAEIPKHIDLRQMIRFTICKILFNYYCIDSTIKNDRAFFSIDEMKNSINLPSDEIDDFYYSFIGVNKTSTPENNSYDGKKSFYRNFDFFSTFINNKNENYSFLIILDNLDKIGLRPEDESNYKQRLNELQALLSDASNILGSYLLVMRLNSISDINKFQFDPEIFTLNIPTLKEIYELRKKRWIATYIPSKIITMLWYFHFHRFV